MNASTARRALVYVAPYGPAYEIEPGADVAIEPGAITMPADHLVARRLSGLLASGLQRTYVTVDTPGGVWRGELKRFEIKRRGTCPECAHCQQSVMTTKWISPQPWPSTSS